MDLSSARVRVRESLSLPSSDDARVTELINEAVVDFARDTALGATRFSFNTVANQSDYSLTSAAVAPNGVLRFLPDSDDVAVSHSYDMDVRGLSTLVLRPTPTGVGAVTGWIVPRPAVLASDNAPLPFPREYDRAVIYRACQLAAEWDRQDPGEIQMWEGKYEAEVLKARRARNRQRRTNALQPSSRLNTGSDGIMLRVP